MTRLVARAIAVVALTLVLSSASQAFPVAWSFEGEFTAEYIDFGLHVGDKLFGGVLFSSDAPDQIPQTPVVGSYDAIFGFVAVPTLGAFWSFAGPNNFTRITVQNDVPTVPEPIPPVPPFDQFFINMGNTSIDIGLPDPTHLFSFGGRAGAELFADDSLPIDPPAVSAFEFLNFSYTDYTISDGGSSAAGIITRIARVPEPGTLALFSVGLVGLAVIRRRKHDSPLLASKSRSAGNLA